MHDLRDRLLILQRIKGLSRKKLHQLRKADPLLTTIFKMSPQEIESFLRLKQHKALHVYQQLQQTDTIQRKIKEDEKIANMITIEDENYPTSLREIPDAPLVLYTIGDIKLLDANPSLSVIGTRRPSYEAKDKLYEVITPLIAVGYTIISGLAYGIDSFAHERTLEYDGKTIAVLGSGFKHIYPRENIPLCREIARKGLLVSEYAPNTPPQKYHFPERNRIISGISQGTLVVEATERSGTLITVDQALEQGKEVFAMPGSPLLKQTVGCHRLIQDGAKLVISATDIYEEWL